MTVSEDRAQAEGQRLAIIARVAMVTTLHEEGLSNLEIANLLGLVENDVRATLTIDPTKIKSVTFLDSLSRYGNKEAQAIMENGVKQFIFAWFDDELSFVPEELVGLTIEEARNLKQTRDKQYLMS